METTGEPKFPRPWLRVLVLAAAAAQTAFWIYTWFYIIGHANPKGDGMELVALGPLTLIFLIFVLPPLLFGAGGRALPVSAGLLVLGAAANAALWIEILAELGGHAAR